jgi:hypothetical protein
VTPLSLEIKWVSVTRLIGCKKTSLRFDELIKDGFEPEDIPTTMKGE